MSKGRYSHNPQRYQFGLSQADAGYLLNLIGADIKALRAQSIPKSKNVLLLRAYSIRDRIAKASAQQTETPMTYVARQGGSEK